MRRRSYIPKVRREDGMLVGRDRFYPNKRRLLAKAVQVFHYLTCRLLGHRWGAWTCDDYDGPGEEMPGGGFMPYCSRVANPGEWGMHHCERCRLGETRWPEAEAPPLWRKQIASSLDTRTRQEGSTDGPLRNRPPGTEDPG